jgi:hypothetical protein
MHKKLCLYILFVLVRLIRFDTFDVFYYVLVRFDTFGTLWYVGMPRRIFGTGMKLSYRGDCVYGSGPKATNTKLLCKKQHRWQN